MQKLIRNHFKSKYKAKTEMKFEDPYFEHIFV